MRQWKYAGLLWVGAAGCGSPLVDAGRPAQEAAAIRPPVASLAAPNRPEDMPADQISGSGMSLPRVPASEALTVPARPAELRYHEVEAGETWDDVARRYGLSRDALRRANPLDIEELSAGQLLQIPDAK